MSSTNCVCVEHDPNGDLRYVRIQSRAEIPQNTMLQARLELARFLKEFRDTGTPLSEQRSTIITIAPLDVDELEIAKAEHTVSWGRFHFERSSQTWSLQLVVPVLYADLDLYRRDTPPAWLDILMELSLLLSRSSL